MMVCRLVANSLATCDNVSLLSNIAYRPYGPSQSWTYGNGLQRTSSYDQAGRLTGQSISGG